MKKSLIALLLLLAVFASACESSTKYGDCVGVLDTKKENLVYHTSVLNVVLAVIFSETIIVPVYVVFDEVECPVGFKLKENTNGDRR
jgi:thioredoxin-related protein